MKRRCKNCSSKGPFYKCKNSPDGLRAICKVCVNNSNKAWREANPEKWADSVRRRKERATDVKRAFVEQWLATHPCIDCSEDDPVVLEFDHVRGKKVSGISEMVIQYCSLAKLEEEVKKCDVRCANCHRRKTAKEKGYSRAA
jgi:hypothetical protein